MSVQLTVSRLTLLTSVASARTTSRSAFSSRMRRPALSPPACSLVWPGHTMATLFPTDWKQETRILRKPEP